MRRWSIVPFTLLCLLALAVSPAAAKTGTWWAAGEALWVEPVGPDFDTAFEYTSTLNIGGSTVGNDFGAKNSLRLRGGWRPKKDGNSYFLSYWPYSTSTWSKEEMVVPIVSDPFFANTFSDRVESRAHIEAAVLDLTLARPLAGTKRSTWTWAVGLRRATYDQDWDIDYFEANLPGFIGSGPEESVEVRVRSRGVGLTAGIGGAFEWQKRWRTTARAQWSLLLGETDASYYDRGYDTVVQVFFASGMQTRGADRVFQQLELEAKVTFSIWRTLEASLGYWFLNWTDASEELRFLDDVQGGATLEPRDVAFHGLLLGVSYRFN